MKYLFISLLALLIGHRQVFVLFGTNSQQFRKTPPVSNALRVMNWNVMSLGGIGNNSQKAKQQNAKQMLNLIGNYQPDIVCMQEYGQYDQPSTEEDYTQRMKQLGYSYSVFSRDYTRAKYSFSNGLAIFSKHPIVAKKRTQFASSPESVLYADIVFGADTIRMFTAHLQSFKLIDRDFDQLTPNTRHGKDWYQASLNIFVKMRRAFVNRGSQSNQVRELADDSPYPEVFCGDLNDVPGSYAYWHIKGPYRNDAFVQKGAGIGATLEMLVPTLRIDYIFTDTTFKVQQFTQLRSRLSDHLPLIADLKLH